MSKTLDSEDLARISAEARDWALTNGLLLDGQPAPLALFPSHFPRGLYQRAMDLMPTFNEMVHTIAQDIDFLRESLKGVDDEFTRRLLDIHERTYKRTKQSIVLGIHRSDYMLHQRDGAGDKDLELLQVELNTISCAFGSLATLTSNLHRYLLGRYSLPTHPDWQQCPENSSFDGLVDGLFAAWQLYNDSSAVVMMVVQNGERNSVDQRHLEYRLWEKYHVRCIRRSLTDLHARAEYDDNGVLRIDGYTVAVAYFRAGYRPLDYPSEKEWKAREDLELSLVIKSPSIGYHLAGAKKVQQVLALPGQLERFIKSPEDCARVRATFAGLYSLDPTDADSIVPLVLKNPSRYLMKPQREGGGNLLTGGDMTHALCTFSPNELASYIIMDRIKPPPVDTYFMTKGQVTLVPAISELGVFGVYLGSSTKTYKNIAAGALLRTKSATAEDGGVVAGLSLLDSVYLTD